MRYIVQTLLLAVILLKSTGARAQYSLNHNIPEKLSAFSVHTVEIIIKKGPLASFSKYQIDVPENIIMKEGIGLEGNFSFDGKRAKYVWVDCPKTDEFTISMIMIVGDMKNKATFEHKFYYIDGEQKKEISDAPIEIEFTDGAVNEVYKNALAEKKLQPALSSTPALNESLALQKGEPAKLVIEKKLPEPSPMKTTISTPVAGTVNLNSTEISINQVSTSQPNSSNTTPISLSENREYRIQIGSFASKPSLSKYSNLGKLSMIEENGAYKLMVGSYYQKEDALKKMEELKTKGHSGFIVSFLNGVKVK